MEQSAHVLIFPFPAQGHINSMLKLSELLALSGLYVTFLNTEYNHDRLHRCTDAATRFAHYPNFKFETASDGLPLEHSRSFCYLSDLLHSVKVIMQPNLRKMFTESMKSPERPPVTCIIADGILTFTIDLAKEIGIPSISFRTTSTCYTWACYCIPLLIDSGELPVGSMFTN